MSNDAYSPSYAFQQSYTSPLLTDGTHTVRLVHAGGRPYIDIDAIAITESVNILYDYDPLSLMTSYMGLLARLGFCSISSSTDPLYWPRDRSRI